MPNSEHAAKLRGILAEIGALQREYGGRALPYLRFYPQDFLFGARNFTAEETGIYIRLLLHEADRGYLPSDPAQLADLAGVAASKLARLWPRRLQSKFVEIDAKLYSVRLESERVRALRAAQRGSSAARGKRDKAPLADDASAFD
jgi:uncharacterized protein YdaU (DUF1376 family)